MPSWSTMRTRRGLFVGLVTLDLLYQVESVPLPDQKIVALDDTLAAGGPATNAAITFAYLGDLPTILGVLGRHALTLPIQADLAQHGVDWRDLDEDTLISPPVSSVLVTRSTGERAVISRNATRTKVPGDRLPPSVAKELEQQAFHIVLMDGHQIPIGREVAQHARQYGIPVVMDGGSWKDDFDTAMPWIDYALCSAHFSPPGCRDEADVIAFLRDRGITHIAITHGGDPITYVTPEETGTVAVPTIRPVDTLGAGDIFHGAFCHFILRTDFREALAQSAEVAARSCKSFGTRHWMREG
ncbi:PfkB family carbohydrate kinase [Leptolyngbya sp. PL-A3]